MITRTFRFVVRLTVVSLMVVALSGAGHLLADPGIDTPSHTAQAVTALSSGASVTDTLPPGFEEAMGYRPDANGKPDGACSVPGDTSHAGFAGACRTHDLGYDLLRFADENGEPLGPWARLAVDRRFHHDMVESCETSDCAVRAHAYGFGVGINSVRQGFTAPNEEPAGPWAMVGALAVITAAGAPTRSPTPHQRLETPVPA